MNYITINTDLPAVDANNEELVRVLTKNTMEFCRLISELNNRLNALEQHIYDMYNAIDCHEHSQYVRREHWDMMLEGIHDDISSMAETVLMQEGYILGKIPKENVV